MRSAIVMRMVLKAGNTMAIVEEATVILAKVQSEAERAGLFEVAVVGIENQRVVLCASCFISMPDKAESRACCGTPWTSSCSRL